MIYIQFIKNFFKFNNIFYIIAFLCFLIADLSFVAAPDPEICLHWCFTLGYDLYSLEYIITGIAFYYLSYNVYLILFIVSQKKEYLKKLLIFSAYLLIAIFLFFNLFYFNLFKIQVPALLSNLLAWLIPVFLIYKEVSLIHFFWKNSTKFHKTFFCVFLIIHAIYIMTLFYDYNHARQIQSRPIPSNWEIMR